MAVKIWEGKMWDHHKHEHLKLQVWGPNISLFFFFFLERILSLRPTTTISMRVLLAVLLLNVLTNPANSYAKIPEMLKVICVLRWLFRRSHQATGVCVIFLARENGKWAEHKINKLLQEKRSYYSELCLQVFFFLHKLLQIDLKFILY